MANGDRLAGAWCPRREAGWLRQALHAGSAAPGGRPRWLRRVWRLPPHDPWQMAALLAGPEGVGFAWQAPASSAFFPVVGLAGATKLACLPLAADAPDPLARWRRQSLCVGPAPPGGWDAFPWLAVALPFFWGGSGLARRAAKSGEARLFRWLLVQQRTQVGHDVWLSLCLPVLSGVEQTVQALKAAHAQWRAAHRRLTTSPPPGPRKTTARPSVARAPIGHGQGAFQKRIAAAERHLARAPAGHKVVLARARRWLCPAGHRFAPWAIVCWLRQQHAHGRIFYWPTGANEAFLGASPEDLARLCGQRLRTHALAGTAHRRGPDAAQALSRSDKDRREHAVVVARIVATLTTLGAQVRHPAAPTPRAAGMLWHLETPIEARWPNTPGPLLLDVARRLHPTPALGGHPRRWALAMLRQQEPWRGLFGGAIGWAAPAGGHLAVAIRCAWVRRQDAIAFAGAGVVRGSRARAEWQETDDKLASMGRALAQVPLLFDA